MDDNKIQKVVGAGSILGILLMIAILFSNGTFGEGASISAAAGLDSNGIVQMDDGEEGQDFGEEDEDKDEMDDEDYGEDEDEDEDYDEDEDEMDDEDGILNFDFGLGWFWEKD